MMKIEGVEVNYFTIPDCPLNEEGCVYGNGRGQLKTGDFYCQGISRPPKVEVVGTADNFTLACLEECPLKRDNQ